MFCVVVCVLLRREDVVRVRAQPLIAECVIYSLYRWSRKHNISRFVWTFFKRTPAGQEARSV